MYSDKLYKGCTYFLNSYTNENNITKERENINVNITGILSRNSQFIVPLNCYFFISENDFNQWLESIKFPEDLIIHERLKISDALITEPFVFRSENVNRIFLVQNVIGKGYERTINVCTSWLESNTNTGTFYPNIDTTKYGVNIFAIDINGDIAFVTERIPTTDFTTDNKLNILQYQEGKNLYAALLIL